MPRVGRFLLPNYPHQFVQRGHNRQVVFAEDADFERYLAGSKRGQIYFPYSNSLEIENTFQIFMEE